MPRYTLPSGKSFFTENELSDEELDSMMSELMAEEETTQPSVPPTNISPPSPQPPIEQSTPGIWETISRPLTEAPSRLARSISEQIVPPTAERTHPLAAFGAGALEGLGNLVSGFTSPINLATGALTGGAGLAARGGLSTLANLASMGAKGAGALTAAHGGMNVLSPESTLAERGMGLAELAGGILGMKAPVGAKSTPTPKGWDLADMRGAKLGGEIPSADIVPGAPKTVDVMPDIAAPVKKPTSTIFPEGPSRRRYYELVEKEKAGTLTGDELMEARQLDRALRNADIYPEKVAELNEKYKDIPRTPDEAIAETSQPVVQPPKPPSGKVKAKVVSGTDEVTVNKPTVADIQKLEASGLESTGKIDKDGNVKFRKAVTKIVEPDSKIRSLYNSTRGMMSVDLPFMTSAALRQGKFWFGTKNWFKANVTAAKTFGSSKAYDMIHEKIQTMPEFQRSELSTTPGKLRPSMAERAGLKMVDPHDVSHGEAGFRSNIAENVPLYGKYVRASNRAFAGFANDLRANAFHDVVEAFKANGIDLNKDDVLLKQVGEFINTSTGVGKLGFEVGTKNYNKSVNLEQNAKLLSDVLFSPRLIASNIRMLNPSTYAMANPMVRKQYVKAMLRSVAAWGTVTGLLKGAGAEVNMEDTTSADFGKAKFGNTRLDPGGGLQQYLVLAARHMARGTTSSTTGKFTPLGKGYPPKSDFDVQLEFWKNKAHPVLGFAIGMAEAAKQREPFYVGDEMMRMVIPMYASDLQQVLRENPELLPLVLGASSMGVGDLTYGGAEKMPSLIPREIDIPIGGRR